MSESSSNKNQESKDSESKEPEKLILRIRSPSEIAYLNAISHASDIDQLVEQETYLTPSKLSQDEHSDLESTSPKLKFGDTQIHEFISTSPSSPMSDQSLSPNQNINRFQIIKDEINPSTPRMKQ